MYRVPTIKAALLPATLKFPIPMSVGNATMLVCNGSFAGYIGSAHFQSASDAETNGKPDYYEYESNGPNHITILSLMNLDM